MEKMIKMSVIRIIPLAGTETEDIFEIRPPIGKPDEWFRSYWKRFPKSMEMSVDDVRAHIEWD